ncbi:leucyl/phenylalanyl-tRNA--protein transferase [Parasphingorhabdus cellanae]|uniref:Leucyl/phenylalanyl-tRNA--protein transferase n=1 Tax=Parasphingorhabdus cellanae TaxID=2806553 RepID=A0ABX7T4P4_9SPHN|nr:leucyl/phenylalanyl-tRNA--protein transferase [Parasphingorhabdus cellanae]QTD54958.1 leucyl/phenylalanyl-tRNA--protein transferase [Parasphingorhabdus cellanae]
MAIELELLLKAYASGIFPMADARDDPETFWVEPKTRAILPLDGFRMSRSLRKTIRSGRFEVTADTAFEDVIAICAESASDRRETWINKDIEEAFCRLHQRGHAHSVECWSMDEHGTKALVGGLYGLVIGGAFCGESMFSRARDASKVALAWLVARLIVGRFALLDCQFMTDHLASLGAIEISQQEYLEQLRAAQDYHSPAFSAIKSPIGSDDSTGGVSGTGRTVVGAGSGTGSTAFVAAPSFAALDVLLATLEDEDARGAVGLEASGGGASSPAKLIAQLLTQTS